MSNCADNYLYSSDKLTGVVVAGILSYLKVTKCVDAGKTMAEKTLFDLAIENFKILKKNNKEIRDIFTVCVFFFTNLSIRKFSYVAKKNKR